MMVCRLPEGEIAAERLVRPVEEQPAELALGVQRRGAGVAAGRVDVREEIDRHRAELRVDVAGRLVRADRLELRLRRVELAAGGVLLHDAPRYSGRTRVIAPACSFSRFSFSSDSGEGAAARFTIESLRAVSRAVDSPCMAFRSARSAIL